MKKSILMAAALLAASLAAAQTHYGASLPQYEQAVQVNGKAEMKVTPDRIHVAITVKSGDIKNQSVDQIESRMKSELKALGVDVADALRVTSMANAPKRRSDVDTRRSYELKVGDVWTLGAVFELLGEMGIADARVVRISHSRMEEFRNLVRIEAVKNARENARMLAEAVGQSIGPAVWISDSGYYESMPVVAMKTRGYEMADAYAPGTAEQGLDMQDITLTYNISAKFVLNEK